MAVGVEALGVVVLEAVVQVAAGRGGVGTKEGLGVGVVEVAVGPGEKAQSALEEHLVHVV